MPAALCLSRRCHVAVIGSSRPVAARETWTGLRVVVLPFSTLSDVHPTHFSDGLTEEVIVQLGALSGEVEIIAPWSSLFNPNPQRAREIGESLHARYLLEGSTRQEGARVRVTARLVETATEVHVWSAVYDRVMTETLSVQTELAGQIAQALVTKLKSSSQHRKESVLCE